MKQMSAKERIMESYWVPLAIYMHDVKKPSIPGVKAVNMTLGVWFKVHCCQLDAIFQRPMHYIAKLLHEGLIFILQYLLLEIYKHDNAFDCFASDWNEEYSIYMHPATFQYFVPCMHVWWMRTQSYVMPLSNFSLYYEIVEMPLCLLCVLAMFLQAAWLVSTSSYLVAKTKIRYCSTFYFTPCTFLIDQTAPFCILHCCILWTFSNIKHNAFFGPNMTPFHLLTSTFTGKEPLVSYMFGRQHKNTFAFSTGWSIIVVYGFLIITNLMLPWFDQNYSYSPLKSFQKLISNCRVFPPGHSLLTSHSSSLIIFFSLKRLCSSCCMAVWAMESRSSHHHLQHVMSTICSQNETIEWVRTMTRNLDHQMGMVRYSLMNQHGNLSQASHRWISAIPEQCDSWMGWQDLPKSDQIFVTVDILWLLWLTSLKRLLPHHSDIVTEMQPLPPISSYRIMNVIHAHWQWWRAISNHSLALLPLVHPMTRPSLHGWPNMTTFLSSWIETRTLIFS